MLPHESSVRLPLPSSRLSVRSSVPVVVYLKRQPSVHACERLSGSYTRMFATCVVDVWETPRDGDLGRFASAYSSNGGSQEPTRTTIIISTLRKLQYTEIERSV